jgi:hypothetical protein
MKRSHDENQFTDCLVKQLDLDLRPGIIETRKAVLYKMTTNDKGLVDMGVNVNTGEPIRIPGMPSFFRLDYAGSDRSQSVSGAMSMLPGHTTVP